MTLRFEQTEWLWIALASLPLFVLGALWFRAMSPTRRLSAILFRTLLVGLLAAVLAGAANIRTTNALAVVAVVDVSGSVRRLAREQPTADGTRVEAIEAVRAFLTQASASRGSEDLLGVVAFDGRALAVASPSRTATPRDIDVRLAEGTDIASALRLARALIPPDAAGRLVLFSDGNQTVGDALAVAREAQDSTPIDVVPLRYEVTHEVSIDAVDAPPAAAAGATVNVRVLLTSTHDVVGTLQLLREGEAIDLNGSASGVGRRVRLRPGPNVEIVQVPLEGGRVHRFRAVFEPDPIDASQGGSIAQGDTITENNVGESFTITPGAGRILLADGVQGGSGSTLARTLTQAGLDVRVIPPTSLPEDLLTLQAYDLVILENVPAEAVSDAAQRTLAAGVQDLGSGLVMVGGRDSFGAGGWKGSTLEPILPVKLDIPERIVKAEAATVLILDNSRSMTRLVLESARTQQEIANDAAALAVRVLDRADYLGVIVFNSTFDVLKPLSPNADPDATARQVRAISSDGGTNLIPALEEARRQLLAVDVPIKHVVVLSDGVSRGKDRLPDLAEAMNQEGIRVSTIAVGDGADVEGMRLMASRGGGTFYQAINPDVLPRLFVQAVRVVRSPLIREEPFSPVLLPTGSPVTAGLTSTPPLGGLVLTSPRPEPTITLAMTAPDGTPLLAHWNAGLGQVAAFTSDASAWAEPWISWPGYQSFWTRLVRVVARPDADRGVRLSAITADGMLRVRLEAASDDGRPLDDLTIPASVFSPSGRRVDLALQPVGPGLYEASLPLDETGSSIIVAKPQRGSTPLSPVIAGATLAEGAEFRVRRSDESLLTAIADATGGRTLDLAAPALANLWDRSGITPREAVTPLLHLLLIWAMAMLLLDIATRRVAWDRWFSRGFGGGLPTTPAPSAAAAPSLATLRSRRDSLEPAPAIALSSDDAARLRAEARDRRRAQRLGQQPARPTSADATPSPAAPQPADSSTAADDASGLLAAKRRAARRFDEDSA